MNPRLPAIRLLCLLLVGYGCSRNENSRSAGEIQEGLGPQVLDVLKVPVGSLDTVASPEQGVVSRAIELVLSGEPHAKILYGFSQWDLDAHPRTFSDPIMITPPATIWAVSEADGERGPVRTFSYTLAHPAANHILPENAETDGSGYGITRNSVGDLDLVDSMNDMPPSFDDINIVRVSIRKNVGEIQVTLGFAAPWTGAQGSRIYVDVGASNISADSFGPGSQYELQYAITRDGVLRNKAPSALGVKVEGSNATLEIPATDLGDLLSTENLAVRVSTVGFRGKSAFRDRTLPIFLNSSLTRVEVPSWTNGKGQTASFKLYVSDPGASHVEIYKTDAAYIWHEVQNLAGLDILGLSTIPIFQVGRNTSGLAGLNASDRGILSSYGAGYSEMAITQLLAHEFAHFQNAVDAKLTTPWLQEGMSEWIAEKVMQKKYPVKAVSRYMYELRVEPLLDLVERREHDPLEAWSDEPPRAAYEKAYGFFKVLEHVVGADAIKQAFVMAYNRGLTTEEFRSYLEHTSGTKLAALFAGWVSPGNFDPAYDPRRLFKDEDGDGLLLIDELLMGADQEEAANISLGTLLNRPDSSFQRSGGLPRGKVLERSAHGILSQHSGREPAEPIIRSRVFDPPGDLSDGFGGLDIVSTSFRTSGGFGIVRIETKEPIDRYGNLGDFRIRFSNWQVSTHGSQHDDYGFYLLRHGALFHQPSDDARPLRISDSPAPSFGTHHVEISFDLARDFPHWSQGSGMRRLCPESVIIVSGGEILDRDNTSCFNIKGMASYQDGYHQLVAPDEETLSRNEISGALNQMAWFREEYGRIFQLDPAHIEAHPLAIIKDPSLNSFTSFSQAGRSAAVFAPDGDQSENSFYQFYLVDAMTRSQIRGGDLNQTRPWIAELFTLYSSLAIFNRVTGSGRPLIEAVVKDYLCFLSGSCASSFRSPNTPTLGDWEGYGAASTVPVRIIMFAALLEDHLGTAVLESTLGLFHDQLPTENTLFDALSSRSPDPLVFLSLWQTWILGPGDPDQFLSDGSLFRFESE